ncbi:hypothetical protein AURDEDRAFT_116994 [Auricularia subglabra TFB-10046 SS5]|nr:hypothetical protein AURDEDRAFT_116994 [Auricularia subglabra TFB-10046 SS5]
MAANETGQFTPTNPLGHPSSTSRALLFYGVGAGALGLLALALVFFCWRRDRWKRSREKRMSFGIDHDHDEDSDKFDASALPSELGGSAAVSLPLMSLSNSDGERSRSRTTSVTFAPLPVRDSGTSAPYSDLQSAAPDDRGAASLALRGPGVISLNDPLPPPRSPNVALHTQYSSPPYLPPLAESPTRLSSDSHHTPLSTPLPDSPIPAESPRCAA